MNTRVLAHRGFSGRYPENTMRAFREAVAVGADGVEFDVQRTRDGELVVFHDERLDYSTTAEGWVKDTSWRELQAVSVRARTGDIIYGDAVPHLDEVLALLAGQAELVINVELKNGLIPYPGIEEQVLHALANHGLSGRTIVSSFNHTSVQKVKQIDSSITTGIIFSGRLHDPWNYARAVHADALHLDKGFVDEEFVRVAQTEGFLVNTYTVNDALEINRILQAGVNGIITNYPDRVFHNTKER